MGTLNTTLNNISSTLVDIDIVDVTAKTGVRVVGAVTSWQTPDGNTNVEHLAGRSENDDLLVLWRTPATDWQVVNVTEKTGQKITEPLTCWQTSDGNTNVEHLASRSENGDLLVFWWTPATDWQVVNVTEKTGEKLADGLTSYQMWDGSENVEILVGRAPDNSLLMYWWQPSRDWQVMDLSDATGYKIATAPENWNTPDGNIIEHFAGVSDSGNLLVFESNAKPRELTDALGDPFQTLERTQQPKNLLTILWDPQSQNVPAPAKADVESILYGETDSVRDYFLENSDEHFTIDNAGVLGWYPADKPAEHYWNENQENDPNDTDGDGWLNGHAEKWAEAIRKADQDFDFAAYDSNSDGYLAPDELGILIVIPSQGPFGTNRPVVGREFPSVDPLIVDGVKVDVMAETYIGDPLNLGVVAHELSHLLLGHGDMYFNWDNPFAAGDYSLMDRTYKTTHLDPFAKLKYGWVQPKVVFNSGYYDITDVETNHNVWVLMDPQKGTDEYFIIENRWQGNSYDQQMSDSGLAVWHVIENPEIYGSHIPPTPPGSSQNSWEEKWETVGSEDWVRRGIRLLKPIWNTFTDSQALWDGSDPATGYDLVSDNPDPQKMSLRWADGTPSGFAIQNIPDAAATMHVYIEVPDFQSSLVPNLSTLNISNDTPYSDDGIDTLLLGGSNNILAGTTNNDSLTGGNDSDKSHHDLGAAFTTTTVDIDVISDLTQGINEIVLDKMTLTPIASAVGDGFNLTSSLVFNGNDTAATSSLDIVGNSVHEHLL